MDSFSPTDLKTILHSKRANIFYLQHCRVLVNGGRVEYVTDEGNRSLYWNIPIANTTTLLLGTGTSITQAAVRELAKAGVIIGFSGGGGSPLYAGQEVEWFQPQSEYRPTQYLQQWTRFWFDDALRLQAAKLIQLARLTMIESKWNNRGFTEQGFNVSKSELETALDVSRQKIKAANDVQTLLSEEGRLTKRLYKLAATTTQYGDFTRSTRGDSVDASNIMLDHGNYLAYGLGATAAWVLGLPHGMAVLHGKTRRGGLVFDVADLVKDALVLPQAFICGARGDEEQEFRVSLIGSLTRHGALDFMIGTLQDIAYELGGSK